VDIAISIRRVPATRARTNFGDSGGFHRAGTFRAAPHWVGETRRFAMGFGKGLLLWIIGIPLPIILLLALFWR
jgi:hypothetical protein